MVETTYVNVLSMSFNILYMGVYVRDEAKRSNSLSLCLCRPNWNYVSLASNYVSLAERKRTIFHSLPTNVPTCLDLGVHLRSKARCNIVNQTLNETPIVSHFSSFYLVLVGEHLRGNSTDCMLKVASNHCYATPNEMQTLHWFIINSIGLFLHSTWKFL